MPSVASHADHRLRSVFFEVDPFHRGLLRLEHEDRTHTAIFTTAERTKRIELVAFSVWGQFLDFVREGIWHIWIGLDHILFLLTLLLVTVVRRAGRRWNAVGGFRQVFGHVLKVVTAFTLAHSITLSAAALGLVSPPSRLVEALIALSVVLAALNNLYPIVTKRLWVVACAFGLIHGFGFASVLQALGLPREALVLSLFGFNLGVEIGQVAIIALFLPLVFALRRS